jgi:hypothetical protein
MSSQPEPSERAVTMAARPASDTLAAANTLAAAREPADGEMACPVCAAPMPDLKGGKATICPNCGFKDSCCY